MEGAGEPASAAVAGAASPFDLLAPGSSLVAAEAFFPFLPALPPAGGAPPASAVWAAFPAPGTSTGAGAAPASAFAAFSFFFEDTSAARVVLGASERAKAIGAGAPADRATAGRFWI